MTNMTTGARMRTANPFPLLPLLLLFLFTTLAAAAPQQRRGGKGVEEGGYMVDGGECQLKDAYLIALETFFKRIARSKNFLDKNWERLPVLFKREDAMMPDKTSFGMANISHSADRGDLVSGPDSYFTVPVAAAPHARDSPSSFEINERLALSGEAMTQQILAEHFALGATLSVNKAQMVWPWVGDVCRLAMSALGIYANVNLYATAAGATVAVPPHSDRQDVMILQLEGSKRWKLYHPSVALPRLEQERGKSKAAAIREEEMGEPTHDWILRPGDVMYLPRGYIHTTSTAKVEREKDKGGAAAERNGERSSHSVALTLGLETSTLSHTYENAATCIVAKGQFKEGVGLNLASEAVAAVASSASNDVEWRRGLPVGFLGSRVSRDEAAGKLKMMIRSIDGFSDAENRLKIQEADYREVIDHFLDAADAHVRDTMSIYESVRSASEGGASRRQREEDIRFIRHSTELYAPCGIQLSEEDLAPARSPPPPVEKAQERTRGKEKGKRKGRGRGKERGKGRGRGKASAGGGNRQEL